MTRFDPKFMALWLALGVAIAWLVSAVFGRAWLLPFALGAWLTGGWIALKMINKEDDDE